ncbi:hypothetical protein QTP86_020964, partial [Hemibagrus guttatus]
TLNFVLDRLRPRLTTTAIGAVDLQGAGGNWATVGGRSRGGRRVRRQREKRKGKSVGLRIGTLNVGTMTGKGRELADMMERRKVDILCVQETRWKGSKARSIGAGFKLFYYGVDSKRNGVGVVLKEEFVRNVLEVKSVSYDELYTRLDTREGEKDLYRLARQRDRDGKDVQQVRVIKDRDGRVLTSEESVQRRWKEYFEELMNEENEREKRVEGVNSVEQKVDKIRKDEVRKASKRMKSGKAVGPDDIPVEVWKCLGEAAVEFLTDLFNKVLEMMDQLSEEVRQESPWTMMFADDIVICSESREQVEENLERWRFALERRGMKMKVRILHSYVNDLSDQNGILVHTVEELEKEANEKVSHLKEKLQASDKDIKDLDHQKRHLEEDNKLLRAEIQKLKAHSRTHTRIIHEARRAHGLDDHDPCYTPCKKCVWTKIFVVLNQTSEVSVTGLTLRPQTLESITDQSAHSSQLSPA